VKIWFDLSNSPHINMFAPLIRDLEQEHTVIITCRKLANTIDLLNLHGFKYKVVGVHYGAKLSAKLLGFPIRVMQLRQFLAEQKIDIAISQSSFHSPLVARLLGVRSIYMNDNEHAAGNIPAFICAVDIMVPEFLGMDKLKKQGAKPEKVTHYPGVKEGIYLWELEARLRESSSNKKGIKSRKVVYIRPEPWTAQYYKGSRNFLDELLLGMKDHVDIVLLPRGKEQGVHYQTAEFLGIRVITTALDIAHIAPDCDLFIGAGGTMTREMAVLGIPTISVYQDELLDVDRYLLSVNAFVHRPDLTAPEALKYLNSMSHQPANRDLLEKGRVAYGMIKNNILNG
jgi:predicted glycosyltransferase